MTFSHKFCPPHLNPNLISVKPKVAHRCPTPYQLCPW